MFRLGAHLYFITDVTSVHNRWWRWRWKDIHLRSVGILRTRRWKNRCSKCRSMKNVSSVPYGFVLLSRRNHLFDNSCFFICNTFAHCHFSFFSLLQNYVNISGDELRNLLAFVSLNWIIGRGIIPKILQRRKSSWIFSNWRQCRRFYQCKSIRWSCPSFHMGQRPHF